MNIDWLPPLDVLVGLGCIFIFGVVLGMILYLPLAHHNSELPLEKLSADIIWHYAPDWILLLIGCVFVVVITFMLIGGMWRV